MRHLALAFALVTSLWIAAPVQAQVRSADAVPSVAETRWSGVFDWSNGEVREATLYFRSDGVLIYAYDGNTYDNGRWVQREQLITFNTNDYFAVFTGLLDAASFVGVSHNQNGDIGRMEFTRSDAAHAYGRPGSKD
jgi:hypothetical protein